MKVKIPKILAALIVLTLSVTAFAERDDFDRPDGPLGGNWASHSDMVIKSGRMHNQSSAAGWDKYLAVYNFENANEATIFWPQEGNGISGSGAQLGGVAFVNSFAGTKNGYLIYIYTNELRLFEISNGGPTGGNINPTRVSVNPKPGDEFTVKFNTNSYRFTALINGNEIGYVDDPQKRVNMSTIYAGIMLFGGDAYENDVEAFEVDYVPPSSDNTPPGQVQDLQATALGASSVQLNWTAVGDDGYTGTASLYDIRYSTSDITSEGEFNAALQVSGVPSPKQSGGAESFVVGGLQANTAYFFAIKVRDEADNWSTQSASASATTEEGGGGGGGGGGGSGQLSWIVDDFEDGDLGSLWAANNYTVSEGELTLIEKVNGWDNLAIYQEPAAYGAGMVFSPTNSELYNGAFIPAGLLILMDSPSPSIANGYLLKRANGVLEVYRIINGIVSGASPILSAGVTQPTPQPGDEIEAVITDEGTSKTIDYYVSGKLDVSFTLNDVAPMDSRYVGVSLYGASTISNNLSSFSVGFYGGAGAQSVTVYGGNNQSGPINTQLPEPIQVLVTGDADQPVEGALLDFQLIQGEARFDDLEDFQFQGQVWSEVEEGRILLRQGRVEEDENASGGKYVTYEWVPYETRFKLVAVPFYIPEDGRYDFWVRCLSEEDDKYKFYQSVDDASDSTLVELSRNQIGNWVWEKTDGNVPLSVGMHDLNLIPYHADFKWDKIVVQRTGTAAPAGMGGSGPEFPNMTDENGIGSTKVTFGSNANEDVIVYVYGFQSDGSRIPDPAVFTLTPLAGNAVSMERDPSVPDPISTKPGFESPEMKVILKDVDQNNVPGVTVNWRVNQGEGTLTSATTVSDKDGVASNTMVLNFYQSEDYIVQASVAGLTGSPVSFTITPTAPPTKIVQISPLSRQEANVNTTLDSLLTVRILIDDQTPFEGYPVEFEITQGEGQLSSHGGSEEESLLMVPTDVEGYARAVWTLGMPGLNLVEARGQMLEGSPVTFEAMAQTGSPTDFTIVSGDSQSGYIGMPLAQPFVVKLADNNGYPISEQQIDFEILSGQSAYFDQPVNTKKTVFTDNQGLARATLTLGNTLNEEHTVRATAFNTGLPSVLFKATPNARIAKTIQYVSGNGSGGVYQEAEVTTTLSQPFVIKTIGPYGNPAANQPITFKVMGGGGDFNGAPEISLNTDAQGMAQVTLSLGRQAGDSVHVVHATASRVDAPGVALEGSPVIFKATGLPKPAIRLVKIDSTDAQTGEVGMPLNLPIQVKVTDEYKNVIKNHPVTFKIKDAGGEFEDGSGKGTIKVASTNSDGIAQMIWHMPATPGLVGAQVSGTTSQGAPLEGSPLDFSATAREGAAYRMTRITVDSTLVGTVWKPLEQKLKVQITDRLGNSLRGQPVTFKVVAGNGLLNGLPQVTIQTTDSGYARVEWQLGKQGGIAVNVVEASASVDVNQTITFRATGLPDEAYRLVADSSYTPYGNVGELLADPVKVQIVDQFGNGVPDQPVGFEIVPVDNNTGYLNQLGVTSSSDTTNEEGFAQVRWGLGPMVGSQNNKMRVSSKLRQVHLVNSPYLFTASAMVGTASKMVKVTEDSNLTSIIGNTLSEYLKVRVVDEFENPIARQNVRFEVLSRNEAQGGSLDGLTDSIKVKPTDSNGLAWVQFTLGNNAGYKINKVQASAANSSTGEPLEGSPVLFEITGMSTNARKIGIVDGASQSGTVGRKLPRNVQVMAMDRYDNPVPGQPIRFRIVFDDTATINEIGSIGPGTAIDTSINTNSRGIAAIQWHMGQKVGPYMLEATSFGDGHLENSPLTIMAYAKAGRSSSDSSTVMVSPGEVVVSNGENRATVLVTLRDEFSNPVSGKAVSIRVTGESNMITQPVDTTNMNGEAIGYVASRESGLKYVSARDMNNGVALKDSAAQVIFMPANASRIVKAPGEDGDTQTRNVNTVLEHPLKVKITDTFGNPIKDVPVTYKGVTGNGAIVDNQPVFTDSLGIAASQYRLGAQPGANVVEARSPGLSGSPVNFSAIGENPEQITQMQMISGNYLAGGPGQDLPEPLRIRVLDNRSWPVSGLRVIYEVLVNDAVITSNNPLNTDMYGEASVTIKLGTSIGLNLVRASLVDLSHISVTFYDTTKVIPGSGATAIQEYAGNDQNGYVKQTLATPLTVRVVDAYGNPVPEYKVNFMVVENQTVDGVGTLEGGVQSLSKMTNEVGLANVYYTLGEKAGLNKIRASGSNLTPDFIEFNVYGTSSVAHSMRKWSGDNQTGEMDRVLLKPVTVRVFDRFGNPARGGRVNFVVLQGGGTIIEPQPILSDAEGYAAVHWKLGPRPNSYTNVAQAVADDLPGGTYIETFSSTGDPAHWPRLQLPDQRTVNEGEIISFNVYATDSDNPPIACTAGKLPDSSALFVDNEDGTYTFSWQPDHNVVQSPNRTKNLFPVFQATDMKGGKDIDSVKIVVQNVNRNPLITNFWPTGNPLKIEPGSVQKIDFGIETMDPDGDIVTVTWYVDDQQVGYGNTWTMDMSLYPPYKFYNVRAVANDNSVTVSHGWGVKVPVELVSFTSSVTPYEGVVLEWETASEVNNLGFHVLRSVKEDGDYVKITESMIEPSRNGLYSFNDNKVVAGRTYYYKIEDISKDGTRTQHGPVEAKAPVPEVYKLAQNFPNPFNPTTTIRFDLPEVANVKLEIYNILGQKVRTLIDGKMDPGFHTEHWDGQNDFGLRVSSGVYYYRISAGEFNAVKKMALLK